MDPTTEPRNPVDAGLCGGCRHARRVTTPRSVFVLCERSASDPRYPRYPRLPVRTCTGYEAGGADVAPPGLSADLPESGQSA